MNVVPRVGMLATVRNRRGLVAAVEPFDGATEGRVHLVTVEYLEADGPGEETLLWEREPKAQLLEPSALPDPVRDQPMIPEELDALVRATRWTALTPFLELAGHRVAAPFHGAIQVEDFQLVPLLKALRMPRISLLLADDVGLGKTIEAGLILSELIIRRRIRRALILCPASLRTQWRQEMREKFSLAFDIIDRRSTHALQKRLGLDANPWRTFPWAITSYDYMKQPDVLEQFRAACRVPEGTPHLPWDLLILDEAHNLAPAPFGEDSDVAKMLKLVAPWFEHRLFLTATPHNGHTRSFTGLLEYLDPVRFTRKSEPLTSAEKERVEQVCIRRLKSEINARTDPPRFSERSLVAVGVELSPEEQALATAFQGFRARVRSLVASAGRREQLAGRFAVEVLGKRLLSCPVSFADSWHRYREGMEASDAATVEEVQAAERAVREETGDDREAEGRSAYAASTVGAWLKPLANRLTADMAALESALDGLGLSFSSVPPAESDPIFDSRFSRLVGLIDELLGTDQRVLRHDERLVIFTEYKTTLDYLVRRLREHYPGDGAVLALFGGMGDAEREDIKLAFNDESDPVRILVATDAASEGLNLQTTARYLLHFDIPWNPSRLEQRNGRLDRHSQPRDVVVYHFTTDDDADLKFLAYVLAKVNTIREDLGPTSEVFEVALQRRLLEDEAVETVTGALEARLNEVRGRTSIPRERETDTGADAANALAQLASEVDLTPDTLHDTLEIALGLGVGRPRLEGPDARGRFRFVHPIPPGWEPLVDESLRLNGHGGRGALPGMLFDPGRLVKLVGNHPVFRTERDTVLLHLGHPLFRRALASFARARFPGKECATRWTVRRGRIPAGAQALLLLSLEELAVNELRETFHHWVRIVALPVVDGELGSPLPGVLTGDRQHRPCQAPTPEDIATARSLWNEVAVDAAALLRQMADDLTATLGSRLKQDRQAAVDGETERFVSRHGEVSALIEQTTVHRLTREVDELRLRARQGWLFDPEQYLAELERSIALREEEIRRRSVHYEELREQLQRERDRVVQHLLPRRYTLRGKAQVFPVAVEIRLPEVRS